MARNPKSPQVTQEEQEEMTVVIFKLKGASGTLQKGFDAINTAFASFGSQTVASQNGRRIVSSIPKQIAAPSEDSEESVEEEADEPQVTDQQTKAASAKPRLPYKPKFIPDFDLNQGDQSWKDFASARTTEGDKECYLVAALWLTEKAKLSEFTAAQIFTLFRAMKWNEQTDFTQPLRILRKRDSYFTNPTPKTWKLTGPGLDAARAVKTA
jgi:hypothetical protein